MGTTHCLNAFTCCKLELGLCVFCRVGDETFECACCGPGQKGSHGVFCGLLSLGCGAGRWFGHCWLQSLYENPSRATCSTVQAFYFISRVISSNASSGHEIARGLYARAIISWPESVQQRLASVNMSIAPIYQVWHGR